MSKVVRCILNGPVGAGKSTLSKLITQRFPINYICCGDVIREHINKNTEFGTIAIKYISKGQAVPDDLVTEIMMERLKGYLTTYLLLDGYPRTPYQCETLDKVAHPTLILKLDVPKEVIIGRLSTRLIHHASGRTYNLNFNPPKVEGKDDITGEPLVRRIDDSSEAIETRIEHYYKIESQVSERYEKLNIVHRFSGATTKEIWPHVNQVLENHMIPKQDIDIDTILNLSNKAH